jgi:hypothetical protein
MTPEFLVCMECETPCYNFEWEGEHLQEALCEQCGNDDVDQFATPDEFEQLTGG